MSEPILKTPLAVNQGFIVDRHQQIVASLVNCGDIETRRRNGSEIIRRCNFDLDAFASELHKRIMNIQFVGGPAAKAAATYSDPKTTYKVGHNHARHAAADLVLAMVAALAEGTGTK